MINGAKMYITNGPRADFVLLVTRTSDVPGHKGISLFLVDMDSPGISVSRKLDKVGMRSSDTAELIFEDVRVPTENLLGEEGKGFYQIMWELQGERLYGAAACVKLLRSFLMNGHSIMRKREKLLTNLLINFKSSLIY